jgi:hypothetical protein
LSKKYIAGKIAEFNQAGVALNLPSDFLASVTEKLMALNEQDVAEITSQDEEVKAFYMKHHNGKEAHPFEMSIFWSLNRPKSVSYNLTAEEMDWFEQTSLSLSPQDFGWYRYPTPPAHMTELTRALNNLKATNDPRKISEQEDTFAFFMDNSEVFSVLVESEDIGGDTTAH